MPTVGNDVILYKRLLSYVLPYWRIFLLSIAGMLVLAITDPMLPALLEPMINGAFVEKDPAVMTWVPVLLVLLFAVKGIAAYIYGAALYWVSNRVVMDLRQQMFARMLSFPCKYYDEYSAGSLMSKFTYDVIQIKEASTNAVTSLVRDSLGVLGLLAWMFYIDW